MRRQRGVRKLETYKHEVSQMEVPIYLDTNKSLFLAEIEQDGWRCSSKDLREVKADLVTYLDARVDLGWREIIHIEHDGSSHYGSTKHVFGFQMSRYVLSSFRVNGRYLKAEPRQFLKEHPDHDNLEKYYLQDSKAWPWGRGEDEEDLVFPMTNDTHFGTPAVFLEFNEDVWNALKVLQKRIKDTAAKFQELIASQEGVDRLEAIGQEIVMLLEPPKIEYEEEIGNISPMERRKLVEGEWIHPMTMGEIVDSEDSDDADYVRSASVGDEGSDT